MIASVSLNISLECWASTSSWWSAKFIEKSLSCRRKLCCCFIVKLSDAKVFDGEKGEKSPILWPFRAEETTVSYMGIVLLCWFSHVKQKICIYCDKKEKKLCSSCLYVRVDESKWQNTIFVFPNGSKTQKKLATLWPNDVHFHCWVFAFLASSLLFLSTYIGGGKLPPDMCVLMSEERRQQRCFFSFISLAREREFLSIFHHLHTRCDKSATTTATANKFVSLDSIIIIHQHWRIFHWFNNQ